MNKPLLPVLAAFALAIGACSPHGNHDHPHEPARAEQEHGHPHSRPAPAEKEPGHHDHAHGGGISVTHYSDTTELFVEYPPLVRDENSAFVAHLTWLADFRAVSEGVLTVTLSGGGHPEEHMEAGVSATAGIFRPVLRPRFTGKRRLTFVLTAAGNSSTHDLGEVEVYADRKTAEATIQSAEEAAAGDTISFTKEQQWKIDFANTPAGERELRESVAVTATLRPRASGEAEIAAPGAGLLNAGPDGFPQVGLQVTPGQVLAYMVPRLGGETDVATLELAVQRARIEAQHARRERERLEGLLAIEAIPAKRVVEAQQRQALAEAELRAAEQRSATYHGSSGGIPLKSPIVGTVVAVNINAGAAVAEGQKILHIAELDKLWLEARLPESELGQVTTPAGAFFQLEGNESPVMLEVGRNAQLVAYGGLVDKETRTVPVIFEFDNPGRALRAGMNVRAQLYTGRMHQGTGIPASATVDDNGQLVVFVQKEGESFERRVVQLGLRDGDWVAVKTGVAPGERVVTKGAYQVRLAATAPAAVGHGHAH